MNFRYIWRTRWWHHALGGETKEEIFRYVFLRYIEQNSESSVWEILYERIEQRAIGFASCLLHTNFGPNRFFLSIITTFQNIFYVNCL